MRYRRIIRGPSALVIGVISITGTALAETAASQAVRPGIVPATLRPQAGQPMVLELHLPKSAEGIETTWANANVAQCFVRSGGRQTSFLPLQLARNRKQAVMRIERPGPALLCVGVGPPEARGHSDSWQRTTHCAKIVLKVQPKDPAGAGTPMPNPGITAKTGQKVEILPLMDPSRLRVGDDLGVRVYFEGIKVEGAQVTAVVRDAGFRGAGTEVRAARPTDAHGTTRLRISKKGTWVVRFIHKVKVGENPDAEPQLQRYVAELMFEVPEGGTR